VWVAPIGFSALKTYSAKVQIDAREITLQCDICGRERLTCVKDWTLRTPSESPVITV